jgi:hypothetical protein
MQTWEYELETTLGHKLGVATGGAWSRRAFVSALETRLFFGHVTRPESLPPGHMQWCVVFTIVIQTRSSSPPLYRYISGRSQCTLEADST